MLNAVRAPLTLGYLAKNTKSVIEKFVDYAILSLGFKIFEGMLKLMTLDFVGKEM